MHLSKHIRRVLTSAASLVLLSLSAVAQPLNGTYTVGGTTPNYATLSVAITDLNNKGVSGPVTFNIRNGNYTGATWQATINNIAGASATNRITIKSETNSAANVSLTFVGTAANNFVLKYNGASFITLKDLTLKNTNATNSRVLHMLGASSSDSVLNCVITSTATTSASTLRAAIFADGITGSGNVFNGNTIQNSYYGIYYTGTSETSLADMAIFYGNTITNTYQYEAYFSFTKNLKFKNNILTTTSASTSHNGVFATFCDEALEITGNSISGLKSGYGLQINACDGNATNRAFIANNVILFGSNTTLSRGISSAACSYMRVYNNTINITCTSATVGIAGYFFYDDPTQSNNEIYNNVFSNTGGGRALFVQNPFYNNAFDYNDLYVTGAILVQQGLPAATYANLTAWRTATNLDMNSVSLSPAFTSATNLVPNPALANSWALNGRGIQLNINSTDINGVARATTRATGVPDIGAYEFTPTVVPPNATATPAAAAPGITQVFTFASDTVATITWDAVAPSPANITVKQYTGTLPPGINAISATSTYFYTDITVPPAVYGHATNIYYKDPWLGTIGAETGLRLAQKDGANPWVGYAPAVSKPNIARNFINTINLTTFGLFTGIDLANNASAAEVTDPIQYTCSGTFPVKVKVKNTGNNVLNNVQVGWSIDGVAQTAVNYTTAIPVSGEGIVTLGNITLSNIPKDVKVWTFLPNGQPDLVPEDDTTVRKLSGGLSGIYTVGGTTPNFLSVTDAVTYLHDFGVCGPVIFNIRDGNYTNQQAKLNAAIDGMNATNRVTFQSESQDASAVNISFTGTNTVNNFVFQFNNSSYFTLKNLTLTNSSTTLGRTIELTSGASFDSVLNCRLVSGVATASDLNMAVIFALNLSGGKNVFLNNKIENGSYGIHYRGVGETTLSDNPIVNENTFTNQFSYGGFFFYTKDLKFNKNIVRTNSTSTTYTGVASQYGDEAIEIIGNKITGAVGGYGLYIYYSDGTASRRGKIINNVISIGSGTNTVNGLRNYYSSYMNIYNNSVNITSTSATNGYAGYFYYDNAIYQNNEIYNNSFSNNGGGLAMYMYSTAFNNKVDYNNLFTTGTKLVQLGTPAATYDNLTLWRAAFGLDKNSIFYNPGYSSTTDLQPNVASQDAWSLNGRGIHIAGNDKDFYGSPRVTALADGVPDIGAYEFTPGTIPPAATATPAVAAAGTTQVYSFGEDTVAVIAWKPNSVVPATVNIRQYTGTVPPQFPVSEFMYFYTDVDVLKTTYQFDASIYYKDPWLGTTIAENQLKLAQKFSANPWVAYIDAGSNTNITRNTFSATDMTSFGLFTGIDNGAIFSARIIPLGSTIFCTNGSVTLQANTGAYTYQWQFNGVDIPGATNVNYVATSAGDYTVKVTNSSNVTATSLPVAITIIAPPAAIITATGPLNYCPGGTLALNANTGLGLSYQWQLNGNNIPGATTPTLPVAAAGSYTITVKNIACATTSQIAIVNPGPLNVQLGLDTTYCESDKVLVLDAGYPGASYTWSTGATTQQLTLANQSGKFWVFVDAGPNCQAADTINVHVDPLPSLVGISFLKSGTNTYEFSPAGPLNVVRYLWIFSDGNMDTAKNVHYVSTVSGPFSVKLIAYNACGTDTTELTLPLDVTNTVKEQLVFRLYPNPAQTDITLSIDGNMSFNNTTVINNLGQVMYRGDAVLKNRELIDVTSFPTGHYIIRATATGGGVISKPFDVVK